jgi:hypothetical protein
VVESASDFRVLRVGGVESEMELPYAGLHQMCAPMFDRIESLPDPQRDALETVFGVRGAHPPDRFMVGLAVLGLLSNAAEQRPVLCVIDDVHWLDRASVQVLAFVARRLLADRVGVVFATRDATSDIQGLQELVIGGLRDAEALVLLGSASGIPLDIQVRERIAREAHGIPWPCWSGIAG